MRSAGDGFARCNLETWGPAGAKQEVPDGATSNGEAKGVFLGLGDVALQAMVASRSVVRAKQAARCGKAGKYLSNAGRGNAEPNFLESAQSVARKGWWLGAQRYSGDAGEDWPSARSLAPSVSGTEACFLIETRRAVPACRLAGGGWMVVVVQALTYSFFARPRQHSSGGTAIALYRRAQRCEKRSHSDRTGVCRPTVTGDVYAASDRRC